MEDIHELISDLHSDRVEVQAEAARKLGNIGDPLAVPDLIKVLNNNVICHAAEALAQIGDSHAIEYQLQALQGDDDQLRYCVTQGFWHLMDNPQVVDAMRNKRDDPLPKIRENIAIGFGVSKDPQNIQYLSEMIQDVDKNVRQAVVDSLRVIGTQDAIPSLLTALNDEDVWVCGEAIIALGTLANVTEPYHVFEILDLWTDGTTVPQQLISFARAALIELELPLEKNMVMIKRQRTDTTNW